MKREASLLLLVLPALAQAAVGTFTFFGCYEDYPNHKYVKNSTLSKFDDNGPMRIMYQDTFSKEDEYECPKLQFNFANGTYTYTSNNKDPITGALSFVDDTYIRFEGLPNGVLGSKRGTVDMSAVYANEREVLLRSCRTSFLWRDEMVYYLMEEEAAALNTCATCPTTASPVVKKM